MDAFANRYAASIVARQPAPPRRFARKALIGEVVRARDARILVGLGAVLAVGFSLGVISPETGSPGDRTALLVGVLFGTALMLTPLIFGIRMSNALRRGVAGVAQVDDVELWPKGDQSTLASMTNGIARGSWTVTSPNATFTTQFEVDLPWALSLTRGSLVQVLVHPSKEKVLFVLDLQTRDEGPIV